MAHYEIDGIYKRFEEDSYTEGCLSGTAGEFNIEATFKADTLEEVIKKASDFLGGFDMSEIQLSEDSIGSFSVSIMEDGDGVKATESELEQWKAGKKRLWLCDYDMDVYLVSEERVDLSDLVKKGE
jgi:hypothetical protein